MADGGPPRPRVAARLAADEADLQAIVEVRRQVFVVEQGVAWAVSGDPQDREAYQVVGLADDRIVGVGRLVLAGDEGQIAWVAVLPAYRRLGIGRAIMLRLLELADEADVDVVLLNAQTHALGFYQGLGFRPFGQVFTMGGIEHQLMTRPRPT